MSFISLDTERERWMWGGVIGGLSVAFVAISLSLRRACKKCRRKKAAKEVLRSLYSKDDSEAVTYVEGKSALSTVASAPPYEVQL